MSELEKLRESLRKLYKTVEDAAIENDVYFDVILESKTINLSDLKLRVAAAQGNLEKRKEIRERYSQMWTAIETAGIGAFAEDLLKDLPPSHKPN